MFILDNIVTYFKDINASLISFGALSKYPSITSNLSSALHTLAIALEISSLGIFPSFPSNPPKDTDLP